MNTYRAAYYKNWVLTTPDEASLPDAELIEIAVKAALQPNHSESEAAILLSAIRRMSGGTQGITGISVKFYTYTTKATATLGVAV